MARIQENVMAARTDRNYALLKEATTVGMVPGVAVAAVFPDGEIVSAAAGTRDTRTGADLTCSWFSGPFKT